MLTEEQVVKKLNKQAKKVGSVMALFLLLGQPCSLSFFHDVLKGRRGLSASLASKLGYEKKTFFLDKKDG